MSFLCNFNILVAILLGSTDLLGSNEDMTFSTTVLSAGLNKKKLRFSGKCKKGTYFSFDFRWYSTHLDIIFCPLRIGGWRGGVLFKGCVRYIFASLFFKFKQEYLSNYENMFISIQKLFLFSRKSIFRILYFEIS